MTLLVSNSSPFCLKSPFLPRKYPRSRLRIRRRRPPELRTRSSLDDALKTLISSLPSPNSLNLVPQFLALASGAAALYLSRFRMPEPDPVVADWILFTSPTPFNRSVLLRCPSVSFEDGGDESDRLLRDDRHYVNLSRGKVPAKNERAQESEETEVGYQRVCVGTEDGGVVSLDWPENLDLGRDYGLDTMVLIVPGTPEGSMDRDVRLFVVDALNKGCFPIVMNPRGCAGSPLTTARLFTAADSDDICTAIRYINRLRPWTTLMGVGCGYGANMLTKYLAEVGERSPLTAAVCIDNPFDLEEATRSIPHHISMDQKLTGGLTEILRANKELFQGKSKGFNVAKALSATSVRDFDGAISMVSYGFDTIEDFYAVISTRQLVHKVKIPVLFIQSDGGTVPLFSVPRSSIAENPFTSLLLCSCLPSAIRKPDRSAILWCQQLAIEWLAAVELAFLKGRHPLIKDVDITINPSKGLASLNGKASEKTISAGNRTHGSYDSSQWFLSRKNTNASALSKQSASNAVNGFLTNPLGNASKESDGAVDGKVDSQSDSVSDLHGMQKDTVSTDEGEETTDSEESQVLQTASVVMNMLDVSMPGTLDDEEKKKVLAAMEQGETLMKALQGAVPEDVRGKLTTAVTDILQTQGTKLNLSGLRRIGWVRNVIPEGKPMVQEKLKGNSTTESGHDESHSLNQRNNVVGSDGRIEDGPSNVNAENNNTHESIQSSQEKAPQASAYVEAGSEMESKPSRPQNSEKASGIAGESIGEQHKVSEIDGKSDEQAALDVGNGAQSNETEREEALAEPNKPTATNSAETLSTGSSASEHQVVEQGNDTQKKEERITEEVVDQNVQSSSTKPEEQLPPHSSKSPSIPVTEVLEGVDQNVQSLSTKPEEQLPQHSSNSPSISVTQALNALTGFDDSTQVAVNSVFGVLEEMIDHFEKTSNEESFGGTDQTENEEIVNASKKVDDSINKPDVESDVARRSENPEDSINNKDTDSYEGKNNSSEVNYGLASSRSNSFYQVKDNDMALKDPDNEDLNKIEHIQNFPLDLAGKEYWESPYAAYLHRYFSTPLPAMESLDSDSTMDLYLDPEGGHWKMIDHAGNYYTIGESGENQSVDGRVSISSLGQSDMENIIEPSYVILDNEYSRIQHQSAKEHGVVDHKPDDPKAEELMCLVKNALLDALKIELGRRLGVPDLKELESSLVDDLEQVADAVSQAVIHDNEFNSLSESMNAHPVKLGTIEGDHIIRTISSALKDASHLRNVLPLGVITGSSLATLRTYFQVVSTHDDDQRKVVHKPSYLESSCGRERVGKEGCLLEGTGQHVDSGKPISERLQAVDSNNGSIMVGAVTAALGASALLAHHQDEKTFSSEGHDKLGEVMQEKNQSTSVSSFAEKAMSVAAPVVPTKSDGEVDQDRLVAVLAELGQKGGMLSLVGKVALLWGGIRGAMSLTDRLISFLHIAERPLFQRVLGFGCMVLVLWSPIVIPLLPTIVQCWTTKSSNRIVEYACIIGAYVAITMLVMIWGKRIRGYENPFEQYGLHLPSTSRVLDFLKGLAGGVMIVLCIHSINALLGYACLSLPSGLSPSSTGAVAFLKTYGSLSLLALRGTITATAIAMVEELLFRSWLTEEVAADYGYYHAILISGLAFSLIQRSLPSIPGFLLLSLALFGMKQRSQGKLYAPIGMRAGIMTTNFFLRTGGFLTSWPGTPFWLASTHPWHPFDSAVGISSCAILAIIFYPSLPPQKKEISRAIHD